MLHSCRIVPIRLRLELEGESSARLRGVGYRFVCRCGVEGDRRRRYSEARADGLAHRGIDGVGDGCGVR
jgi:hypothetical protein